MNRIRRNLTAHDIEPILARILAYNMYYHVIIKKCMTNPCNKHPNLLK